MVYMVLKSGYVMLIMNDVDDNVFLQDKEKRTCINTKAQQLYFSEYSTKS